MKLGLKSAVTPKAKPGDFERALQLAATFGSKENVTAGLKQLRDAKAGADEACAQAQATERNAGKRESEAQAAETDATRQRQLLADETSAAMAALGQRETAVASAM